MLAPIVVGSRKPHPEVARLCAAAAAACQLGDLKEAERLCHAALDIDSRWSEAVHILGVALARFGNHGGAVKRFRQAIALHGNVAEYHANLGNALYLTGDSPGAVQSYKEALRLDRDNYSAHFNLSVIFTEQGRFTEAEEHCRAAIALHPERFEPQYGLGVIQRSLGLVQESIAQNELAAELGTDWRPRTNAAFAMLYSDRHTPEQVAAAHRAAGAFIEGKVGRPVVQFKNDRSFTRRIRVGIVSADLRRHAVACFLLPLLRNYDPKTLEITAYAEVARPDDWTEGIRDLCGRWCSTVGFSDDQVAKRIRSDEIDVLIDLSGHTQGHRLFAFARRAAPVQVTWLGYPHSLGMKQIDYRLVDAITDPPGHDEFATEKLVRMDPGFLCYDPPVQKLPISPSPWRKRGCVTFGSFSMLPKLSPSCLEAWAELLKRAPSSRLLLKTQAFGDDAARKRVRSDFERLGVDPERIKAVGFEKRWSSALERYGDVDIALDPWPYCGTTTTMESLWMGVPVISLKGATHHSRVGASILSQVGLEDLVAANVEEYVAKALELATDPLRMHMLRTGLREKMRASPLCDGEAFASRFEDTVRGLFATWCDAQALATAPSLR